jgi:RNA polymerase sigma factor (sigma-70 family)
LEASALTHASRRGLLARPSRLLRLQKDERLIAMMRNGHEHAFEVLFERYQARLLGFCQHMLACREDAEDVLQEVFVAAHHAILADNRTLNVRPWLYRIARNRCLNHLRKPVPEGQDSMDIHPHENGASTAERVQNREEFRQLIADVQTLPETQRTALLLREVDAMSYEEIAQAMDTTVPSIKSLLVRARITLAESSQSRLLTCGEVQLELAEAAEGLRKVSGPVRQHVRACEACADFRTQLRADSRALAALFPVGPLLALKHLFGVKLAAITGGGSSAGGGAAAGGAAAGGATAGGAAAGGAAAGGATAGGAAGAAAGGAAAGGAALGGAAAGGGIGGALVGGLGAKTAAGVATAALLTAGAVEVKKQYGGEQPNQQARNAPAAVMHSASTGGVHAARPHHAKPEPATTAPPEPAEEPPPVADQYGGATEPAATKEPVAPVEPTAAPAEPAADGSATETDPTAGIEEEGSGEIEIVPEPVPIPVEPAPLPPEPEPLPPPPAKPPLPPK